MSTAKCTGWTLACLLAVAAGCDGETKPKGGPVTSATATAAVSTCTGAHQKELEKTLLGYCEAGENRAPEGVPSSPWRLEAGAKEHGLEIVVEPGSVRTSARGRLVGELASELAAQVAAERSMAKALGRPTRGWLLVATEEAPSGEVIAVLDALAATEAPTGFIALKAPSTAPFPAPPDAKALARMHALVDAPTLEPSQRAVILAKHLTESIPSACDGVERVFGAIAAAAPDQKCRLLARGIPEGLVECHCEDEDLLVSLIYGLVVGTEAPTHRVVHAPVTLNAEAEPVEVPAGQPWKATIAALKPSALSGLKLAIASPTPQ